MNLVDSSAWLEFFANTTRARYFLKAIEDTKRLLVPTIVLYEVFKKVLHERDESSALRVVAHMRQGNIIDFDLELSVLAAQLSDGLSLPMADSIILATARKYEARLWTQDADFKGLDGVEYVSKT
ncbi:MAG: type II toxin-antitoxin system VapC family toxin [bacterium]|nr:type II toxin-antitoxin system VapC family toxin [bacterium]